MTRSDIAMSRKWRLIARTGAGIGVTTTILYAIIFILYAVARSTLELLMLPPPDAGRAGTILAAAISLTIAAMSITILLLPLSAIAGGGTSLLIDWIRRRSEVGLLLHIRPFIGFIVPMVIVLLADLILLPAVGLPTYRLQPMTSIFWMVLPALIYIVVSGLVEWKEGSVKNQHHEEGKGAHQPGY